MLRREGIDFVKVDGQSAVKNYYENDIPVCRAARETHKALEGAAGAYMGGRLINCMGMSMENILGRQGSAMSRNSDDFLPNEPHGFTEHLLQNAYNAVYHDGVEALRDEVSQMLGIPIDYYICVDVEGFVQVVDAVGGIDFDVPIHMAYDDPLQNLHIHFEPGMQHINGKEALAICRLRNNSDGTMAYPDSDIGRTRTQQQILTSIAKKLLENPQKVLEYIEIWNENVVTNLKAEHTAWFVSSLLDFPRDTGLSFETLPGDGTVKYNGIDWCYELYPEEVLEIVNEMLNPYTEPLTEQELDIFQVK